MSQLHLLNMASIMLRARLAHRVPLGVNIISPYTAELPADLNDHPGRFVGFFFWLEPDRPSFALLTRNQPGFGITHVHIFYPNGNHKEIPARERSRFSKKKLAPHVNFGVVNLKSALPRMFDLSVLLAALELKLTSGSMSLGPIHFVGVTLPCNIQGHPNAAWPTVACQPYEPLDLNSLWDKVSSLSYKWIVMDPSQSPKLISSDFDVIKVVLQVYGHVVYAIHYRSIKCLGLIIPHSFIFRARRDFDEVQEHIKRSLGSYKLKSMVPIRYFGSPNVMCNEAELLRVCLVALEHPFAGIRLCEVDALITDEYFERMTSINNPASQFSLSSSATQKDPMSEIGHVSSYIQFSSTGDAQIADPNGAASFSVVAPELSTQATEIFSSQAVMLELDRLRERYNIKRDLADLEIPPVSGVKPYDDIKGDHFNNIPFFVAQLEVCANLWRAFVDVKVLEHVSILEAPYLLCEAITERFVVLPFREADIMLIVIIDQERQRWYWLDPYTSNKNPYSAMLSVLRREGNVIKDWINRPISLTSYFHAEHVKIHLLMGIFHIAKLLRYAQTMPQRVFYQEKGFRHYCWSLQMALQMANAEHNMKHRLIRADGYLRRCAMRSMGFHINYQPAVVSGNECPFCLKRGFNNMGRHLSMAHGNQAQNARAMRG